MTNRLPTNHGGLMLWAEADDAILPPLGKVACPVPKDELARLERKAAGIEESIQAVQMMIDQQLARLEKLRSEIVALAGR